MIREHDRSVVAVVGLGAMGSAALWQLAARGIPAIGFEQFEPGHDRGSSHGESRIIRTAYFEGEQYVPLAHRAFALWERLERETGAELLTRTGGLMIGRPDSEVVAGTRHSVDTHHLAHETLGAEALKRRYPQHRLDAEEVAILEEPAGVLRPERAVRAMVRRAAELGVEVRTGVVVDQIEESDEGVTVVAGGETHSMDRAVVAVGPWLPAFLPQLGRHLTVTRQIMAWFPVPDPDPFIPARFPIFIHDVDGHQAYGFPALDGKTVKVAIHREGAATEVSSVDRSIHPADVAPLRAFVERRLAGVSPEPVRAKVCLYTNTPDGHFVIGRVGARGRVVVLGGFSGHGFKFAPVIGEIAADLATTGETGHPIAMFDPHRFSAL
jgi:sarcosine oxidase